MRHEFWNATNPGSDDRNTGGECLTSDHRDIFRPDGGHDHYVNLRECFDHAVVWEHSVGPDALHFEKTIELRAIMIIPVIRGIRTNHIESRGALRQSSKSSQQDVGGLRDHQRT